MHAPHDGGHTDPPAPPQAFLSHASEDKESFVRPLAHELANLGVRPWLDEWEIQPGDSLVQKLFDQGLAKVDAVVIVISAASVNKPWVREELDNAMVRRIATGTRLIPIKLGEVEMPEPLRHLAWIQSDPTPGAASRAANRIADTLHNVNRRPDIGPRPRYLGIALSVPGLTNADTSVLVEVVREAVNSGRMKPLDWEPVEERAASAGLDAEGIEESLHVLSSGSYVDVHMRGRRPSHVDLRSRGYRSAIFAIVPNVDELQQRVIAALYNAAENVPGQTQILLVSDLPERVHAPRVVVEQTLEELDTRGLLTFRRYMGGAMRVSGISPALRRLLN